MTMEARAEGAEEDARAEGALRAEGAEDVKAVAAPVRAVPREVIAAVGLVNQLPRAIAAMIPTPLHVNALPDKSKPVAHAVYAELQEEIVMAVIGESGIAAQKAPALPAKQKAAEIAECVEHQKEIAPALANGADGTAQAKGHARRELGLVHQTQLYYAIPAANGRQSRIATASTDCTAAAAEENTGTKHAHRAHALIPFHLRKTAL